MANKFGYDEVVDTLVDLIKAQTEFRAAFTGKFDLLKFLTTAAGQYSNIKEMIEDFDTFWAQVKDLTPEEAKAAVASIRANVAPDKVNETVLTVLTNLALTYGFLDGTYNGATALVAEWKKL